MGGVGINKKLKGITGNVVAGYRSGRNRNGNRLQRPTEPPAGSRSYSQTTTLTQFPGKNLSMGMQDPVSQEVIR